MSDFDSSIERSGQTLSRTQPKVLQLNLGRLCNLTCIHCHVNAGPHRRELIEPSTAERILSWWSETNIATVDLTGGAPEMAPSFRPIVEYVRRRRPDARIIDRCNLTILNEPGYEDLAEFLAANRCEIVASMPCYQPDNVNEQRGDGVFDSSITALQRLNKLGYGREPDLQLHLVYNPNGAFLPGSASELEVDYKRELKAQFNIVFNDLYTLTNLPIARFASFLKRENQYDDYLHTLISAFNPDTIERLMCRDTLSVDWNGAVYDCDFNQMLDWAWLDAAGDRVKIWDLELSSAPARPIRTGTHCFGCSAGAGSSCGGALV